jgi:hypothetical protein
MQPAPADAAKALRYSYFLTGHKYFTASFQQWKEVLFFYLVPRRALKNKEAFLIFPQIAQIYAEKVIQINLSA